MLALQEFVHVLSSMMADNHFRHIESFLNISRTQDG